MPGHRGTQVDCRVVPDHVVGALAQDLAAMIGEVPFKVAAFQAAGARSSVTCSVCPPPIGGVRPCSW